MTGPTSTRKRSRRLQVVGGLACVGFGVGAVVVGGGHVPGLPEMPELTLGEHGLAPAQEVQEVTGVIGSEKAAFFNDPDVQKALKKEGISTSFTTAGTRAMAQDPDHFSDFAFPSSAPAGDYIAAQHEGASVSSPFYSPLVAVSYFQLEQELKNSGLVRTDNATDYLDTAQLLDFVREGKRWRDITPSLQSPRAVELTTSDLRTSNSAEMYAAVLSYVVNGERPISNAEEARAAAESIRPLFAGQGFTSSSSAGPFERFTSVGMGEMPMVLAYESQLLEFERDNDKAYRYTMFYLSPTINSEHTFVAFNDKGKALADALETDELQRLAARHGFRTHDIDVFKEEQHSAMTFTSRALISIDAPTYDSLELLIAAITGEGPVN